MSEPGPPRRPHPLERGPAPPPPPSSPDPQRRRIQVPTTRPILTYVLLGVIILFFIVQQASAAQQPRPVIVDPFTDRFMKANDAIIGNGEYYRLFTAMFLHGSILHLFFNAYALFIIGSSVELLFGTARFAIIYFLGGLTGSIASLVFTPAPSLGASGAIFALLGAEGVFFYFHRDLFGVYGRSRFANIVFVAAINLVLGFAANSLIDNWGHIGGLFGGLVLAWFIGPRLRINQQYIGGPVEVVDDNPLQRAWLTALVYAVGWVLILLFVVSSLG